MPPPPHHPSPHGTLQHTPYGTIIHQVTNIDQSSHLRSQMPDHSPPYGSASQQPPHSQHPLSQHTHQNRKRIHEEELDLPLEQPQGSGNLPVDLSQGHHSQPQGYSLHPYTPGAPPPHSQPGPQQYHGHRLPNQNPPKRIRGNDMEGGPTSPPTVHGPPSMVGQPGMPAAAPKPRGPKLKFTPEDDQLLVDLKEKKNLTWKQIADFFPGRSSGTLQVRYCTKLKAKTTSWTDENVQKLRTAMQEYENDRWRIISTKVGNGFSPTACRDKAAELEVEGEPEAEEGEESGYTQAQLAGSSSDPTGTYQ